jgi:hypothetical protein
LIHVVISWLKHAKKSNVSSRRWFQAWWKNNELHRIKIKSLAVIQYFAAQESDVKHWFVNYRNILQELNIIRSSNVWNFDEDDFRVSCTPAKPETADKLLFWLIRLALTDEADTDWRSWHSLRKITFD